jgi:hypothetical protein
VVLSRTFLLVIALSLAFASDALSLSDGAIIRITTWNLEWFPNGSPKTIPAEEQAKRIAAAADVLRPLDSDILLLQEVRDYDACARLAEEEQAAQIQRVSAQIEAGKPAPQVVNNSQ